MTRTANLLLVTAFLLAGAVPAAPVPKGKEHASGVLVLDDCDDQYDGKREYGDNLSSIDAEGKVPFRVSGFNNCESIGSNHLIAVDPKRGWAWVLENVSGRIRKFDRRGKELLVIKDTQGQAVAVDAESGHLWVVTYRRIATTVVYDAKGKEVATHGVAGWDIVYDPKGESFWIAGENLLKVTARTGKVTVRKRIPGWTASSVAAHPETGKVWVTVRRHQDVPGSKNQLLGYDNDGALKHTVDLGDDTTPFHVSVSAKSGVWVTLFRQSVRRYSAEGKLEAEHKMDARAASADLASKDVWVVTPEEVRRLSPAGKLLRQAKHARGTSQAWVVSW